MAKNAHRQHRTKELSYERDSWLSKLQEPNGSICEFLKLSGFRIRVGVKVRVMVGERCDFDDSRLGPVRVGRRSTMNDYKFRELVSIRPCQKHVGV